ncbi:MAG: N-6 DNA methylase, partial [Candidatus Bathyarchaeia archaeon]
MTALPEMLKMWGARGHPERSLRGIFGMSILFSIKEETIQGMILRWIDELIKQLNLPFTVQQELEIKTKTGKRKIPDIVLLDERGRVVLIIELKLPHRSPMDDEVVDQALEYAVLAGAPFFATWNINKLVLWETFTPGTSLLDRRLFVKEVIDLRRFDERILQDRRFEERVKKFLGEFLPLFKQLLDSKLKQPSQLVLEKLDLDELLVLYLRNSVDALSIFFYPFLLEKARVDSSFLGKIRSWFVEQGWIFTGSEDDYYRMARQQAYLFVLKILFYNILKQKYRLQDINVNEVATGEELKVRLQEYFNACMRINPRYGIIFASNLIEEFPVPDKAVNDLRMIIAHLNKYDFSKLGYDIIGKVYEKLLPPTERHKLGQYFTPSDVVDLIIGFTVKDPNAKVLDPSCGSGTFLVRAYNRKKYLARVRGVAKTHKELIDELYGVDISKLPAVLSTINLFKENIRDVEVVPKIINKDFFDIKARSKVLPYKLVRGFENREKDFVIELPSEFDVVITNPPYTRQEEMEDFLQGEKEKAWKVCVGDWKAMSGFEEAIGKRSSIYVYFFIHGGVFLKEKGRLGFVTSNSWLNVDYGKYLQKFFLQNFKIIAIIESKLEKWFEDADVNTTITILERCSNKEEKDEHLVKFVQLKVPLSQLVPPTISEEERWRAIDSLVSKIESLTSYYEDDKIRVFPKKQRELWNEGYDPEEKEYSSSKWGKYIRAPPIFFKIMEKGKNIFIPLKEIAEVRRGFTTGANEFFYLTEEEIKKWGIEREFWMHPVTRDEWSKIKLYISEDDIWFDGGGNYFKRSQYADVYKLDEVLIDGNIIWIPNYVIKSPRECKSILVDPKDLKYRVLLIHKDKSELRGTRVLKYIEWGEAQGFHRRPTCESRQRWYELSEVTGDLLCMMSINDRHVFWYNVLRCCIDARLYGIN